MKDEGLGPGAAHIAFVPVASPSAGEIACLQVGYLESAQGRASIPLFIPLSTLSRGDAEDAEKTQTSAISAISATSA
jgi:hypothetical protein